MDMVGLKDVGRVSPEIKALWRDTENFTHRMVGVAVHRLHQYPRLARGIRPGRNELESVNRPVTIGGVLVVKSLFKSQKIIR